MNGTELPGILANGGKLRVAELARLMADNQRTLDVTDAQDRRQRDLHNRVEEAIAQGKYEGLAKRNPADLEVEPVNINIDSPTTIYQQPPGSQTAAASSQATPAPTPASTTDWLKKAAIAAALVGGGAAIPAVWSMFQSDAPAPPVVAPVASEPLEPVVIPGWELGLEKWMPATR